MNFCIEKIGTTITSSQVESDGNECKNLLAPDPSTVGSVRIFGNRSRGFLTDHFVRPPVTLNIRFPACIEISHIIINPKYGTQSSSAFMIQTETSYTPWKSGQEVKTIKHMVAKEYINSTIPNRIIFRNPRFVPRPPFSLLRSSSSSSSTEELAFNLKHPSINACERVIGIEVTILRVVGSSVPTLGGLEIWGQPCVRCTKEVADKLLVTWMRRTRKRSAKESCPVQENSKFETESNCSKRRKPMTVTENIESPVEIPEEFLDPITHDVMCQPIRLPCGVAVDASTLEKYYKEEATWARTPNDPFTGQAYTDSIKPIADGALKTRIDYFITQNSHCKSLQSVPRTLGTGATGIQIKTLARQQFTTLAFNPKSNSNPNSDIVTVSSPSFDSPGQDKPTLILKSNPDSSLFSPTVGSSNQETQKFFHGSININAASVARNTKIVASSTSQSTLFNSQQSKSNPGNMEDYLQAEMAKVLEGGSSYVVKPPEQQPTSYLDQCLKCHKSFEHLEKTTIVYSSTTCSHVFVCRSCVLTFDKQKVQNCLKCNSTWSIKDLQRCHDR